jgi:aspartyl aminopeptidase
MSNANTQDLIDFINGAPTAWHAVEIAAEKLRKQGFIELDEKETWALAPGKRYFVTRNGSSICAFVVPTKAIDKTIILASHTDSPALKLKPNAEFRKKNMVMLGAEVYGGPLLSSWLNRDLGIAGRVSTLDVKGKLTTSLVNLHEHPVTIPQLAIHLDREVNDKGLILNKQEHLAALATLTADAEKKESHFLEGLIRKKVKFKELLGYDLYLYPLEAARLLGGDQELIAAYRIDNLLTLHASLTAILKAHKPAEHLLKMAVFWDNEEIGSNTAQGAGSPFFSHVLERITLALKMAREGYLRLLNNALCISCDLGHALHPNYMDKHDPQHQPLLGEGIILKSNAQQRYVTDAESGAYIARLCHQHKIPLQKFVTRGDIPSGSTIGPIHASQTGMKTVDMGCAQLSMHSTRELAACQDHLDLCRLLAAALQD